MQVNTSVMDILRQSALSDLSASRAYCHAHPEARLSDSDGVRYGFKMETKTRSYFVRCTTLDNDYFYVFAYDKAPAREQKRQEQPSVLKQIRAAEKTPKPPRREKIPGKQDVDL